MLCIDVVRRSIAGCCVALLLSLLFVPSTFGQTAVNVIVCGERAEIGVLTPVSDSVADASPVLVSGTVKQAAQIEVYVDDAFDQVVPLAVGQESFQASVALAPGTHTIRLVAIDACPSALDAVHEIVTTYTPPPNSGGSTGTQVDTAVGDGDRGQTGVLIGGSDSEGSKSTPSNGVVDRAISSLLTLGRWLNLTLIQEGTGAVWKEVMRVIMILIGAWMMTFGIGARLTERVAYSIPTLGAKRMSRDAMLAAVTWFIRGVGVVLVLIAVMIP